MWGEAPKSLLYLDGGRDDSGFGFFTPVDGYAINTAWLGHDLQFGDDANVYYSTLNGSRSHHYTRIGEVFRVEFWLEPGGNASMWGEAMPGLEVTITTPRWASSSPRKIPSCSGCWRSEVGAAHPGEQVTVEAGDGLLPALDHHPRPADRRGRHHPGSGGQVGGYTGTVQVHGSWENGYQEVQADELGTTWLSMMISPAPCRGLRALF